MPAQSEESVREIVMVQESVRETVTVQEGRMPLQAVIFIVGLVVAQFLSKLGKTQGQGIAIWMVIMGAVLFAMWQFE